MSEKGSGPVDGASGGSREGSRRDISRRQFIKAGAVVGVTLAVGSSSGCSRETEEIEKPSLHFGKGDNMSKRVLIGYATKTGSTSSIAEKIGQVLGDRGFEVDVKPVAEIKSVDGYSQVIVGSAVNGGAWLPEALEFVQSRGGELAKVPFAAFAVHAMNAGTDQKSTSKRTAYLDGVRKLIDPADEGFFLGKSPVASDTFVLARWAFRAFGGAGEGDLRDWDAIESWASNLELS